MNRQVVAGFLGLALAGCGTDGQLQKRTNPRMPPVEMTPPMDSIHSRINGANPKANPTSPPSIGEGPGSTVKLEVAGRDGRPAPFAGLTDPTPRPKADGAIPTAGTATASAAGLAPSVADNSTPTTIIETPTTAANPGAPVVDPAPATMPSPVADSRMVEPRPIADPAASQAGATVSAPAPSAESSTRMPIATPGPETGPKTTDPLLGARPNMMPVDDDPRPAATAPTTRPDRVPSPTDSTPPIELIPDPVPGAAASPSQAAPASPPGPASDPLLGSDPSPTVSTPARAPSPSTVKPDEVPIILPEPPAPVPSPSASTPVARSSKASRDPLLGADPDLMPAFDTPAQSAPILQPAEIPAILPGPTETPAAAPTPMPAAAPAPIRSPLPPGRPQASNNGAPVKREPLPGSAPAFDPSPMAGPSQVASASGPAGEPPSILIMTARPTTTVSAPSRPKPEPPKTDAAAIQTAGTVTKPSDLLPAIDLPTSARPSSATPVPTPAAAPPVPSAPAPAPAATPVSPAPAAKPVDPLEGPVILPPLSSPDAVSGEGGGQASASPSKRDPAVTTAALEVATVRSDLGTREVFEAGKTVARVGNEVITSHELEVAYRDELRGQVGLRREPTPEEKKYLEDLALNKLIQRTYITQEAKRLLKDPQRLKGAMQGADKFWEAEELPPLLRKAGVVNIHELKVKMEKNGESLEELRENYRQDFLAKSFLQMKLGPKIKIGMPEMERYYTEHLKDFVVPAQITWREVLIETEKAGSPEKARQKAEAIRQRLDAGEDFATVAKSESDGPNKAEGGLWKLEPGSYGVPAVKAALETLPLGTVSTILEGPSSLHILRVEARRSAGPESFAEVQDKVRRQISAEKIKEESTIFVESLRNRTVVINYRDPASMDKSITQ